jgi:hypothetical protein
MIGTDPELTRTWSSATRPAWPGGVEAGAARGARVGSGLWAAAGSSGGAEPFWGAGLSGRKVSRRTQSCWSQAQPADQAEQLDVILVLQRKQKNVL